MEPSYVSARASVPGLRRGFRRSYAVATKAAAIGKSPRLRQNPLPMTRSKRRRLTLMAASGAVLTLTVILADMWGWLSRLEGWFYDTRAQRCQFFTPPPTTQLVHVDIDDGAMDSISAEIGEWPWPRSHIGEWVDVLNEAGATAVALDMIFTQPDRSVRDQQATTRPAKLTEDQQLGDDIAAAGNVLVPISIHTDPPDDKRRIRTGHGRSPR